MFNLPNSSSEKVYTILELNNTVRGVIKSGFPEYIWVCGEIKDLRASKDRRHIYFDLIQKHPKANEIIAKVGVAIFQGRKPRIFKRIEETDGAFELKNDIEVKFLCEIDLYPKSGQYNLIVVDIDPVYTLGKFAQNRQKIIEELKRKGLVEKNKILPLPLVPLDIGLITSFGSAAYYDFISELKATGYGFKIFVFDAHMQGKLVQKEVREALEFFNNLTKKPDLIVITRGGGSSADLSWFDNKLIAYSIVASKFPVICGLGHEINTTITDLVAHTSLKTPTKVAQFLVEKIEAFLEQIEYFEKEIRDYSDSMIEKGKKDLRSTAIEFESAVLKYFRDHRSHLAESKINCLNFSRYIMNYKKREISDSLKFLKLSAGDFLKKNYQAINYAQEKINLLNPENILKRGYSITLKDSKALKDAASLSKGDIIKTVFFKGRAVSSVQSTEDAD